MTQPLRADEGWIDTPDYPHRIENHVKVYLHLEPAPQPVVWATPDTAPAGTRGYRRRPDGEAEHGTVTGWTSDGSAVFLSHDAGGTYSGPTFGSVYLEPDPAPAERWAVSGVTVDGYPLDGTENGNYCDYEGHPVGVRPDWDRQHQAADALDLPSAAELLPMLADALGTSIDGPTGDQLRSAAELLAEHAEWRSERADLSADESAGDIPAASDWQASDDAGCDLADRAIALLAEITSHLTPVGEEPAPADVPTMYAPHEVVDAAESRLRRRPEPPSMGSGPAPAAPGR
jgi:hypothetical protein